MRLAGRTALVTGAAQGLGAAIARRLCADGAQVVIADLDFEAAKRCAHGLSVASALETAAIAVRMDVTETESVKAAMRIVESSAGGLDILVNNAGVARDRRLAELSDDDWETVVGTSLRGSFTCAREALALLRASGRGRIINMSSRAYLGNPGQSNYSAAKAGILGLTRSLSLELGRDLITVNAVAPGMIDTPLVRNHPKSEAMIKRAISQTPIGRLGSSEDVAAAVAFLASDDASYITGDVLHVTGGRY